MTLPSSGNQISFGDIRIELGVSGQAPFSITSASTNQYVNINTSASPFPDSATPHAISEWYSYQHCKSLGSFSYSQTTPADPGNCQGSGNEYTFGPQAFYSDNCTGLASSCKIYFGSTCSSTAYANLVRYIHDGSIYYVLDSNSVISSTGACTQ